MVQPRLLHPVPIEIQQLNLSSTFQDDDYREPIQQSVRSARKIINGQVAWGSSEKLTYTKGGVSQEADGYVLFRYLDLLAASVTLRDNDRFTKIGLIDTDVYIVKIQPIGHYADRGGATMVKAFFMDRAPARQGLNT